MICAVIVVPTLAPRITPMPWLRFMMFEEMKPTTSTVVTDEDWMTAVTPAPVSAPRKRLFVIRASTKRRRLPAATRSASVIRSIPNKKTASPPNRPVMTTNQSIASPPAVSGSTVARTHEAMTGTPAH